MKVIEMKGNMGGFTLLKGRVPEGHCPECIVKHEPSAPHNLQSMHYQMAFREQHGRWPTWHDAMRHCDEKIKALWLAELAAHGVVVGLDPGAPEVPTLVRYPLPDDLHELKAISIRQPWAWLIVHGPKRWENRDWSPKNPGRKFRGRVLIHAAQGMTRDEYAAAHVTALDAEFEKLPPFHELQRGGIIGVANVIDWKDYARAEDPWAFGSGLVLDGVQPVTFIPCKGALGFFKPDLSALESEVAA